MHRMVLSCPQSISFLTSRPPKWSPTALCITFTFTARVLPFLCIPSLFQQQQPTKWSLQWNLFQRIAQLVLLTFTQNCRPVQWFSPVRVASHLIKTHQVLNQLPIALPIAVHCHCMFPLCAQCIATLESWISTFQPTLKWLSSEFLCNVLRHSQT